MLLLAALAMADEGPLTLDEVWSRVDTRVPSLAAADASLEAKEAASIGARSAFDPTWSVGTEVLDGYYAWNRQHATVTVETAPGPVLDVGWRRGVGYFADYEGYKETLSQGEFFAEVKLPVFTLGRTKAWTQRQIADLSVDRAALGALEARRQGRRSAAKAYWSWVGSVWTLELEQDMLSRARRRQGGLTRQVEAGQRAEVERLDNERALVVREGQVAEAQGAAEAAAEQLSVWYRSEEGVTTAPTADRAPSLWTLGAELDDQTRWTCAAPLDRPDLASRRLAVEQADLEMARARRARLPDLYLSGGLSQDYGDGPDSLQPLRSFFGVELSGSTTWRDRRSAAAKATAERSVATGDEQMARDTALAEVRALEHRLARAAEAVQRRLRAQELAEELLALESRRLELGQGNLLDLLQREQWTLDSARALASDAASLMALRAELELACGAGLNAP